MPFREFLSLLALVRGSREASLPGLPARTRWRQRMGMATLLGQLDLRSNPPEAVRILESAARASTPDNSEPAYVWGMLLAGEFAALPIPAGTLPTNPANGRKWLEWAAEMGYPAAQYKCGLNYEHAQMTCEFNPLLSVQYYSAASQQGEAEGGLGFCQTTCESEGAGIDLACCALNQPTWRCPSGFFVGPKGRSI